MQAMAASASGMFGAEGIKNLKAEAFAPGVSLSDAVSSLGIARTRYQKDYLASWPESQQEAIRATLHSAITRGVPVSFAWAPGYDYEVSVWEAASTPESRSWITVLLRSRYPEDRLPETVTRAKTVRPAGKKSKAPAQRRQATRKRR